MTRAYVWNDSFVCVTWLIHRHDSFTTVVILSSLTSVTWLVRMCEISYSCVFTHMNDLCNTYEWVMAHTWMSNVTHMNELFMCVTWRIHMCDMTDSCVLQDSFICVTWLIHVCDMTHSYVWRDSFLCVTWLIRVWHDSFMCWHVWHDSYMCVTWPFHMRDTHFYACGLALLLLFGHAHMCDMTHTCVWHNSCMFVAPICARVYWR